MSNNYSTTKKSHNAAIDIAKLILAFLVIGIHTEPFGFSFLLDKGFAVLTRICVPFFFVTSSFFVFSKRNDPIKYITRLLILYCVWSFIYLPFDLSTLKQTSTWDTLLLFYWNGNNHALWYLWGSIIGFLITYLLSKHLKPNTILIIGIIFLTIGCIKSTYATMLERIFSIHISDPLGSRNGLFYAFPYYSLGLFIAKKRYP